ncbi:hypothetical protein GP665_25730, partial [Escherichia coli]
VYLNSKNLGINPDQDTSWLKTIFRKHRKAFSFLGLCCTNLSVKGFSAI